MALARNAIKREDVFKRKLVCATCGQKIRFTEGKFCWNREQRFGGFQYCREHQQQVTGGKG